MILYCTYIVLCISIYFRTSATGKIHWLHSLWKIMESIIWRWACYFFGWEMSKKEKSWAICYASFKRVPKKVKGKAVNVICTIMIAFLLWFHSQSVLWGCCCWWYFQAVVKSVHVQVFRQRAHTMALLLLTSHLHLSLSSCFSFLEYIMAWMVYWCNFVGGREKGKWDLSLEEDFVCCLVVVLVNVSWTTKGNFHKDFIFVMLHT